MQQETTLREALAEDLLGLALLHSEELDAGRLGRLREAGFPEGLALRLERAEGREAQVLCGAGLADIPDPPDGPILDILAAEYADIYLNHTFQASPCESVWIDDEGLAMQEPMFQVRGWYRRHGLTVPDWRKRTDDHLVCQLHFVALALREGTDWAEIGRFLDEHLLRWIGGFADRVRARAATRFYAGLAILTAAWVEEFRDLVEEITGEPRPSREEIDRRMRPVREIPVAAPGPYVPGASASW